ncbi:kinesin, putative, partial [Bodo saltans]
MSAAIREHAASVVTDFTNDAVVSTDSEEIVNRCLVFARIRPANARDYEDGATKLVSVDKKRIIVKDERHYDFDGSFDQNCNQVDIFNTVATPCIQHAFKGFCSALMCYGQTGTGKSFTMCCTKPGIEGIIPRSARYIFERAAQDSARKYTIQGQFIQIYRDQLGDLMSDTGRDKVDIRFETVEGVSLPGCSTHSLRSETEFMNFYNDGNQRRVVMATAMNPESSRGHSAMVIWISSEPTDDPCGSKFRGKITFIDLAGYERFSKTGISNSNAVMKDEAKTINASLLSLGHVVTSLSNGDKHIPWRNSKLTRLLQDSIGGRSRTSIILTIGPSSDHLHETTNSLQFGLRAMAVKVEAKLTVTIDYEKLSAKLQAMLDEKNERISLLELQIAAQGAERSELQERHMRDDQSLHQRHEQELAKLIAEGADEQKIKKLKEVYAAEAENLLEQHREEVAMQDEMNNKEIVTLVAEQQKQEHRRHAEMKLVQERLIEEFQEKLESARGGTNEDLIHAIQQLSEKDTLLASRANDTVRLHEHIEALTAQIREMGGQPLHEAKFPETFLDISQVEELQAKLQAEVERGHQKVVDLKAQLERVTLECNDRLELIQSAQ